MPLAGPCPSCGNPGKGVGAVTLRALLTPDGLAGAGDGEGYRHCAARGCHVAYFHPDSDVTIDKSELLVRVGTKETNAPRPLCYCFDHSWESIEADVRETGSSDVVETITARCRAGEDRCPATNPQGACCLGNVRLAVKDAKQRLRIADVPAAEPAGGDLASSAPACCTTRSEPHEAAASTGRVDRGEASSNGSGFLAGGAVVVAALSSACCWLPLLLIAVGAGTSTLAGFFEAYRPWFLAGTAVLLGTGFFLVYRRQQECEPGGACEVRRPRLERFNKGMLWFATFAAVAFALFPSYAGTLISADSGTEKLAGAAAQESAVPDAGVLLATVATAGYRGGPILSDFVARIYDVDGMTCAGCEASLKLALMKVSGVRSAAASYEQKVAIAVFEKGEVDDIAALAALKDAGYEATLVK